MSAASSDVASATKPLLSEVDVFGITHPGLVRAINADHFVVASFHRAIRVHATSLPPDALPLYSPDSRGFLFLVADGVGSMAQGHEGSARVADTITRYLVQMSEISLQAQPEREAEVLERLRESVSDAHQQLRQYELETGAAAATTITMFLMLWPCAFIAHAGDSRGYRLRDGKLERLTMDQTMAQALIESGTMTPEQAERSRFKDVLLSAAGGHNFDLDVSVTDLRRDDRTLLCTDGLTKHVSEDEIRDVLASDVGSERVCRDLLALALERGGEDNVTIVTGRAKD